MEKQSETKARHAEDEKARRLLAALHKQERCLNEKITELHKPQNSNHFEIERLKKEKRAIEKHIALLYETLFPDIIA